MEFEYMSQVDLQQLSTQLESPNMRDRLLALVALKDVAPVDAVPLLKKVIHDESLQVRSMAVFALGIKPTDECYPLLAELVEGDEDYSIRAAAAGALGYLEDIRALEMLKRVFYEDTSWLVRYSAAVSLGNLKDPSAREVLTQALKSPEVVIQQAAIAALGEIKAVEAVDQVLRFAQSSDWIVRQRLAESLGNMPTEKSVAALKYLEKDSHPHVSGAATISLQRLAESEIR
jgi:HEAT repeat protein